MKQTDKYFIILLIIIGITTCSALLLKYSLDKRTDRYEEEMITQINIEQSINKNNNIKDDTITMEIPTKQELQQNYVDSLDVQFVDFVLTDNEIKDNHIDITGIDAGILIQINEDVKLYINNDRPSNEDLKVYKAFAEKGYTGGINKITIVTEGTCEEEIDTYIADLMIEYGIKDCYTISTKIGIIYAILVDERIYMSNPPEIVNYTEREEAWE